MSDMTEVERPRAAFVLSLIAGIFILLGGVVRSLVSSYLRYSWFGMVGRYRGWGGMIGYPGFRAIGTGLGIVGILGLIFGAIVIISAVMLIQRPQEHSTWGILIVIFSVLSIFGAMGGLDVGLILGLIGGVLALTWHPTRTQGKT